MNIQWFDLGWAGFRSLYMLRMGVFLHLFVIYLRFFYIFSCFFKRVIYSVYKTNEEISIRQRREHVYISYVGDLLFSFLRAEVIFSEITI